MYSSIEESERADVISLCYWPLLRLAKELSIPLGIEASGYTLEAIAAIDNSWIEELRSQAKRGLCEFIGSGYCQLIGPLVPADVNKANLELGHDTYEKLLGLRPKVALVNEQAYSAGLIQNYLDAGYRAVVMEWDNPSAMHKEWPATWRYLPQNACGYHGEVIPVIWNKSLAFQQFQRYVHGDQDLDQYLAYLHSHLSERVRAFPLYGNDVEVFDYRPGRFATEPLLKGLGEWKRVEALFRNLKQDERFSFISPSRVLELLGEPDAGNHIHLESAAQPVPVKKQEKYNLGRWALSGRDDTGINSACFRLYRVLKNSLKVDSSDWRELCYLWSSDFRTHITDKRWAEYSERLAAFKNKFMILESEQETGSNGNHSLSRQSRNSLGSGDCIVKKEKHLLIFEGDALLLKLNTRKGMAVDGLWLEDKNGHPLLGTLRHGYYDNIRFGADWYSGHLVMELLGKPKITDLEPIEPVVESYSEGLVVKAKILTSLGAITKSIFIDPGLPAIKLSYETDWAKMPFGSFRLGFLTLHPKSFARETLFFATNNGGYKAEYFKLAGASVDHGAPVSFLVSSGSGLGLTEGWVMLGDASRCLQVSINQNLAALIGLVRYQEIDGSYFFRLAFSASELDDTVKENHFTTTRRRYELSVKLFETKDEKL